MQNWQHNSRTTQDGRMKKVIVLGPESTGKSTLCEMLAAHFNTIWCAEYAREYLTEHGTHYTYDDLLTIAKGQLALEENCAELGRNSKVIFVDTGMYVMKVWCEFVFEKCHKFILDKVVSETCDLYLLCNTDLEWTPDALREYPDLENREKLFYIYKDIMVNQDVPFVIIEGQNKKRLEMAIQAVDGLLARK
jgi:NadR type nicotinamide-nucleotide adenylyltransferase